MTFSIKDKTVLEKFLSDVLAANINGLSSMDELLSLTNPDSRALLDMIIGLDPYKYGFKGELVPQEPTPTNVVKIKKDTINQGGEYELDSSAYLPKQVFDAFSSMAESFHAENPNRELLLGSGYRSPAFQIVILLYIFVRVYDFDIAVTLRRVALPQYSQHCSVSNTAIDLVNVDGEPTDENPAKFKDTIEYEWLLTYANQYGFYESYPLNNPEGIMWEPWHWQYRG